MDFIKKCHPYQWRVYPLLGGFNNAQRKFEPKISGAVHVRPKSAKEIGYTGRITSINTKAKSTTHVYSATELHVSQKKRKLTEDMRVTIQQHCYHHTEKYEDCITCHSTKHDVRPSRLVPVYDLHLKNNKIDEDAESLVLLTPDTTTYRQLAASHLRPNDYVLEIGCSTGECTALLLRRNLLLQSQNLRQIEQHNNNTAANVVLGNIVGFDTGAKILKQADNRLRREYNQSATTLVGDDDAYSKLIQLHRVDALADPKGAYALATSNNTCPGMVLIDIGGNRQLESVVRMIQWVQTAFKDERPRLILVKSEALENELSTALLSSHTDDNTDCSVPVPSVTDEGTITNGQIWFNNALLASPSVAADIEADKSLSRQQLLSRYSHPKKVPLVLSPKGTPICRYHNYHPDGCTKFNKSKSTGTVADEDEDDLQCQYDHEYCHWCQDAGHIAVNCPSLK